MSEIDTSPEAIAALMNGVTPGEVRACNMTHADHGGQMTAEEIGEYIAGCVRLGDPTRFLFLAGKSESGDDIDVCHIGNGPRGPANARFLAACFELVPALAAERDAMRAEVERLSATQPEVAALVEALRPFSEAATHLHPVTPDEATTLDGIQVGQWRAAYAALAKWEAAQK